MHFVINCVQYFFFYNQNQFYIVALVVIWLQCWASTQNYWILTDHWVKILLYGCRNSRNLLVSVLLMILSHISVQMARPFLQVDLLSLTQLFYPRIAPTPIYPQRDTDVKQCVWKNVQKTVCLLLFLTLVKYCTLRLFVIRNILYGYA